MFDQFRCRRKRSQACRPVAWQPIARSARSAQDEGLITVRAPNAQLSLSLEALRFEVQRARRRSREGDCAVRHGRLALNARGDGSRRRPCSRQLCYCLPQLSWARLQVQHSGERLAARVTKGPRGHTCAGQ